MVPEPDSVQRFTDRVADYARHRPGYPAEVVSIVSTAFDLSPRAVVADVGSGTGLLSREFLRAGFDVFGVEPNEEMRAAACRELADLDGFHDLDGRAESLPLPDRSVALVTAGQAFHWFDQAMARREFQRVLRPAGGVALVWNNRRTASSRFLEDYESMLLEHCPDYVNVGNKHYDETELQRFFGGPFHSSRVRNRQFLDRAGFVGRIFSSSYTPASGPARRALEVATHKLFDAHAEREHVCIDYDTELFYGRLTA